jgi:4-alpha-glucanotransferase
MRFSDLRKLARLYDVQITWVDATGKRRKAPRETLEAVLKARVPRGMSFEEALKKGRRGEPEPVVVVWDGQKIPKGEVELESGATWRRGTPLPHGYHVLHRRSAQTLLIHAPREAFPREGRTWGLFVPLYAAHTRRKARGDLGVLSEYADWIRGLGGTVVATLPLLAAFEEERSPYSPVSRLFWNERYLDLEKLPEYVAGDDLAACARRFVPDDDFRRFAATAREYAEFRGDVDYHLYVQYRMARQMREIPDLYLDYPLGVHPDGYDAWKYAPSFASGVAVGAPPDAFFTKGQNWGFRPFDPDAIRADRYAYIRAAMQHHMKHAGILRLDHVMGLHRLYWIPDGFDAKDGVYVRYHDEELYAIVTLESVRHRCAVVGEDLGTVPDYVPRAMERHGLRRMYVVQYEARARRTALPDPPRASVASVNTHDMPTFTGFWTGQDIDDRVGQGLLDERGAGRERESRAKMRAAIARQLRARCDEPGDVLEAVLKHLAASPAEVVLVNPEDLWGELEPQNVPGVPERSWTGRFRLSLEEAAADRGVRGLLEVVSGARLATWDKVRGRKGK